MDCRPCNANLAAIRQDPSDLTKGHVPTAQFFDQLAIRLQARARWAFGFGREDRFNVDFRHEFHDKA
jgi:hypothetical protein